MGIKGAELTTDFAGGSITSDGGLLLVRQFDERIGLSEAFSQLIHDPRDPRFILHDQLELIRQRLPPGLVAKVNLCVDLMLFLVALPASTAISGTISRHYGDLTWFAISGSAVWIVAATVLRHYDPRANRWSPIPHLPVDLWGSDYTAANGQLLVSGGVTDQSKVITNQGFSFSPAAGGWTRTSSPSSSSAPR